MTLPQNDRAIARFTMLGHALVHWFELAIPILLIAWLAEFEASMAVVGVIVALGYAPFGLGALPGGLLADRFGPKRLIVWCLAGMSAAFVALAFAPSIYAVGLCLLAWGVAASLYHPAGLALISTGVDRRPTVFARHGIAGNLGIALGPFATATLLVAFDWRAVSLALAVPGMVGTLYGLRAQFDPTAAAGDAAEATGPATARDVLANSKTLFASAFALVFAVVTLVGLFYRAGLTYLPEILNGLPAVDGVTAPLGLETLSLGEYFYVWLLVAGMAGQYAGGKLTGQVPVSRGIVATFAVLAALPLAFVPVTGMGLPAILVLCGVFGFTLFAIEPFYQEAVATYTPPDARGLAYGYTYLGMFGLGSLSITAGGILLERYPLSTFFAALSAVALVGVAVSSRLLSARVPEAADAGGTDTTRASATDD